MDLFNWFRKKTAQRIENISGSQISQVFVDQHIHNDVSLDGMNTLLTNMKSVIKDVVRAELNERNDIARQTTVDRTLGFDEAITSRLSDPAAEPLLEKFDRPDVQRVLRTALIQYIDKGDEETKDEMVDLLIDRLNLDDKTIERSVVDEAIGVLPKLSKAACCLLVFMLFRELTINGNSLAFISNIMILGRYAENLKNLSKLDIEYLKQLNCCQGFTSLKQYIDYEKMLLSLYDDFFRDYGSKDEIKKINSDHPELIMVIDGQSAFVIDGLDGSRLVFCSPKRNNLKDILAKNGYGDRYNSIVSYLDGCPKYDEARVRDCLVSHSSNWNDVLNWLNTDVVQGLNLTPLGMYIAKKVVKRSTGVNTPALAQMYK